MIALLLYSFIIFLEKLDFKHRLTSFILGFAPFENLNKHGIDPNDQTRYTRYTPPVAIRPFSEEEFI